MTKRTITLGMSAGIALTGAFLVGPNAGAGQGNDNGYGAGQFEAPGCGTQSACVTTEATSGAFAFFGRAGLSDEDDLGAIAIKLDGEDLFIGWASDGVGSECTFLRMDLNGSGRFLGFGVGGSEPGDFSASFWDETPDNLSGEIETATDTFNFEGDVTRGFIDVNCA